MQSIKYERFQWNWLPYTGTAGVLVREVTDDAITGCWASEEKTAEELKQQVATLHVAVVAAAAELVTKNEATHAAGSEEGTASASDTDADTAAAALAAAETALAAAEGQWNRWTYTPGSALLTSATAATDTAAASTTAATATSNSSCVDVSYKALVDSNSAYEERTLYTGSWVLVSVTLG